MIHVHENPPGVDEEYLRCLNVCFPGAWRELDYHWYMKRPFASRKPDMATVHQDNLMVAGMGVNYRTLDVPGIGAVQIAVFTAAWTLPAYRGKWHFARLIREASRIARDKECVAALSFVTADNASAAVLRRAGARPLPATYLHASPGMALELPNLLPELEPFPAGDWPPARFGNEVSFHYATDEDWRAQMIDRPNDTVSVCAGEVVAVVEQTETTDRLQFLSGPGDGGSAFAAIARSCLDRGRTFFHFTTSDSLGDQAREYGLRVRPGYIMLLDLTDGTDDTDDEFAALLESTWHVQAGDRM